MVSMCFQMLTNPYGISSEWKIRNFPRFFYSANSDSLNKNLKDLSNCIGGLY